MVRRFLFVCGVVATVACSTERPGFGDGESDTDGADDDTALDDTAPDDAGEGARDRGAVTDSDPSDESDVEIDDATAPSGDVDTDDASDDAPVGPEMTSTSVPGPGPADAPCSGRETRSCELGGYLGNCSFGTQTCQDDGKFGPCDIPAAAADECEPGDDANCNGEQNEGCACVEDAVRACASGGHQGDCSKGVQTCLVDGTWSDCSIQPAPVDDCADATGDADCDGTPRSGCACTDGETQDCGPVNAVGICEGGTSTCVGGEYKQCEGAVEAKGRDCSSASDNDCDGVPDNTIDAVCKCSPGSTQACEEHPGLDGNPPCMAGSQVCNESADGTSSDWGPCSGSVGPALRDSCSGVDDSNCNGIPNEGCMCTSAADCNDGVTCTEDGCNGGSCENTVLAGYCVIAGACIAHNTPNPSNPCQICNATLNSTGWSNASASSSCDDGLWCTGADTCNGAGVCVHEFPSGNRCSGVDLCDKRTCDEVTRTCFEPSSKVCRTSNETQCVNNNACGSQIQTRTITAYCTGSSSGCPSGGTAGNWAPVPANACGSDQRCSGSGTCSNDLSCVAWCDSANICWSQFVSPTANGWQAANTYCANGTWAGRSDWRLATFQEYLGIVRGCQNGTATGGANDKTSCVKDNSSGEYNSCGNCPANEGPDTADDGCYWVTNMSGPCENFWVSDASGVPGFPHWAAYPGNGSGYYNMDGYTTRTRCVVPK